MTNGTGYADLAASVNDGGRLLVREALRLARATVATVVEVLLVTTWGGAVAVQVPAARRDAVAEVIASYQATIPELMAQEHIPGLAVALVGGDRVMWQQGFGHTGNDGSANVDYLGELGWRPCGTGRSRWSAGPRHSLLRSLAISRCAFDMCAELRARSRRRG